MKLPKEGSIIEITVLGKKQEVILEGYNYGLGGKETGFYIQGNEHQRYSIDFLDKAVILYEPIDEEEDEIN